MSLERMRIPTGPLALECLQHELTYVPLTAAFLAFWMFPGNPATWIAAPVLFATGACSFIYNFFLGKEVREKLARRQATKMAREREGWLTKLRSQLPPRDIPSLDAMLTMEAALHRKIQENRDTLEMTGAFSHTYDALVAELTEAGLDALQNKAQLARTAEDLKRMGAGEEARNIASRIQILEDRVKEVRERLSDALVQLAVMDGGGGIGEGNLESLSKALTERLALAAQIT